MDSASRRPGRPPLPPERRLSVTVQVCVTADEADRLYGLARRLRVPLSDLVRDACLRMLLVAETSAR